MCCMVWETKTSDRKSSWEVVAVIQMRNEFLTTVSMNKKEDE